MIKRTTISLDPADESAVAAFADASRVEHEVLAEWTAEHGFRLTGESSDAAVIRALLRVGVEALREQALDRGYAALAASVTEEERNETRALRERYAQRCDRQLPA